MLRLTDSSPLWPRRLQSTQWPFQHTPLTTQESHISSSYSHWVTLKAIRRENSVSLSSQCWPPLTYLPCIVVAELASEGRIADAGRVVGVVRVNLTRSVLTHAIEQQTRVEANRYVNRHWNRGKSRITCTCTYRICLVDLSYKTQLNLKCDTCIDSMPLYEIYIYLGTLFSYLWVFKLWVFKL